MKTFRFDKLVRDKIVDSQLARGSKVDYHVLEGDEYIQALNDKLLEEATEIDATEKQELLKELADLQEVMDAILEELGYSKDDLAKEQASKNAKSGGFKKRLYVEKVSVDNDDEWIDHFLSNPDKYPEEK